MSASDSARACCLTAPGTGGIAVVQVIGPGAPSLVGSCLRSRKPLDIERLAPDQIRLCELVEEEEIIDDVLVCARRVKGDDWVIDLNVHGGPRIVERLLMLLQKRGAHIIAAAPDAMRLSHARNFIEQEALQLLPLVQTRPVADWLLRVKDALCVALKDCQEMTKLGRIDEVQRRLKEMTSFRQQVEWLIHGARIAVTGRPNAGKSTLVNAFARREQILVSDTPGTTRDYIEQPAAIDGVPVVLVDTAGIRETSDPLEQEAIRRGRNQADFADLILELVDSTAQSVDLEVAPVPDSPHPPAEQRHPPRLQVRTKIDRPRHPLAGRGMQSCNASALRISAVTAEGLPALQAAILDALGLTGWPKRTEVAFAPRQHGLLSQAASELARANKPLVLTLLEKCLI